MRTSTTVNPHQERSLLMPQATARWEGFPLAWVTASPTAAAGAHTIGKTLLAMLDTGSARAEFGSSSKSSTLDLQAHSIGVFVAGTDMKYCRWRCDEGVRRIMVELDFEVLSDPLIAERLRHSPMRTQFEFHDRDLAAVLRAMVREVTTGCLNGRLFAESLSLGLALRLQERNAGGPAAGREKGRLTPAQMQRLEEFVQDHLARNIPLRALAELAGFSPAQFVRLFKNSFGCTPHRYVLQARLARGRALVVGSALPLARIATEVGFASQSHMTSSFVRAFKTAPGEMRRVRRAGH
jgi:AraC-like DNA-binding protein